MMWLDGVSWAVALGALVGLAWIWGQDRLTLLQFFSAILLFLGMGAGVTSLEAGALRWFLFGLLVASSGLTLYLAFPGEDMLGRLEFRSELRSLRRQMREDPDNPEVFVAVGELLQSLRRFPDALSNYQRAMTLEPDNREYRQRVQQLQHIMEGIATHVKACPACSAPVYGSAIVCPKCGQVVNEYLYLAHRFGREQYLFVAATALATLLLVFLLGSTVPWRPRWLLVALVASSCAVLAILLMRSSRKATTGG